MWPARKASSRCPADSSGTVKERLDWSFASEFKVSACASLNPSALAHARASDTLLLARSDDRVRRQVIVNELIGVGLDQFTVHHEGLFREYIACRIALRRIEKDVPRRTPLACVAGQLAIAEVRSLLAIFA